uniref:Periostin n=1 Tax=Chelydra serpentina TaxID=8475 RepID=A0A8C3S3T7_CHESE
MKILFLSTFSIFLLSAFDPADSSAHYDKILSHSRIRAREQGPNVCALQQVMGTKKKYFSTCRNWYQGTICGKKATTLYECCPGYMKMDGMRGCPAVAPIDHVYGTLGIVGATSTQRYSDMSKLREEIEGRGSFTFFAPSNEAWELLDQDIHSNLIDNVNIELYNALHNHMVNKRMLTKDLKNGLTLVSMYNDQQLFINHYPNGLHRNYVPNSTYRFTCNNFHLQDLAAAITSGVLDTLGKPGHYTLFAPTNEAFEKLPRGVLERIMGDKVASEALIKYHILNTLQCSEAIMGGAVYETLEGSTVEVGCDGESLTVNGVKMANRKDIVTSNGVIHLIDHVLIPNSAKQVIELAGDQQTTFTDLLAQLGLTSSLRPEGQYTLLAPLNGAFSDDTLRMDQRLLKLIMQNHILKVKIGLNELYNGQNVETLGGKQLRIFVYRTAVCIENSCMVRGSKEGRNGVIHIFRQIIKPAEKSLREVLKNDKRFSIFLNLVKDADLEDVLSQPGEWTLFVPTNEAFKGLTDEEKEILRRDKNALRNILLYHLTKGIYIGNGFEPGVTNILKTIQGSKLFLKTVNDTLLVNELTSKESDLMTTNGVIHVIDKLLYPVDVPVGNDQLLTILNKMIKYIQIKFVHGSHFQEIPLTFFKPVIETYTKIIDGHPVKVTEKKVTEERIIQGPETKYTRITEGGRGDMEGDLKKLLEEEVTKVTKFIEGDGHLLEDEEIKRLLQGGYEVGHKQPWT